MAKDNLINDDVEELLIVGGLAVGAYFVVVLPIMRSLGISGEDTATVQSVDNSTPDANPFSVQFQESVNNTTGSVSYPWAQSMLNAWNSNSASVTCPIVQIGEGLWNAFGNFYVDNSAILALFNQIGSQLQVSQISQYLLYAHNIDLWTLLKNGNSFLPLTKGLYDNELATIVNHVKALPVGTASNQNAGCPDFF